MELHYLEEISSTNTYAKENLASFVDKTVIYTGKQTAGRGRFDRKWVFVGEENLYLSIVLKPCEEFKEVYSNITQYAALTLAKIFEKYGLNANIKWPNDILIKGKKISGILAETVISQEKLKGIILGIGINLNASQESFVNIEQSVTALNLEIGQSTNKQLFLNELLNSFFIGYDNFLKVGFSSIKEEYLSRCDFIGSVITVNKPNGSFSGIAKEINDSGILILTQNGINTEFSSGDIIF